MDLISLVVGLGIAAATQVLLEFPFHRWTQRKVFGRVDREAAKAQADRAEILATVADVRKETTSSTSALRDLIEAGTEKRIAAAEAQLEAQFAGVRSELEARERALAERAAQVEAEFAAKQAELAKSAEMSRRGAIGAVKRAELEAARDAILAQIELKWGPGATKLAREQFSGVVEMLAKWKGTPLADGLWAKLESQFGGGTVQAPAASSFPEYRPRRGD